MTFSTIITYVFIAFALSMDAFCVSVTAGICIKGFKFRHMLTLAVSFGFAQFIMPLIGWSIGETMQGFIKSFDHWIAFALLGLIGVKMIRDSAHIKESSSCSDDDVTKPGSMMDPRNLLKLSVATSIDAMAVGVSFALIHESIVIPSLMIGAITFGVCLFGCYFGKKLGVLFEKWAEVAGGVVLIGIGLKILIEHLAGGI